MAGTAMGLVISAFANTRDQATTIVSLALVPASSILAGVLVPKLPAPCHSGGQGSGQRLLADRSDEVSVHHRRGSGPDKRDAHPGALMDMTAEQASYGAAIVAAHALGFSPIA